MFKEVFKGVDLKVCCGFIFGLFGFNGVGKFIFINIFVGLVKKFLGMVWIWGIDIDKDSWVVCVVIGVVF